MFRRLITPAYLGGVADLHEAMALVTDTLFPSAYLAETVPDPESPENDRLAITRRQFIERALLKRASIGRRQTLAGMIAQSAAATCVFESRS